MRKLLLYIRSLRYRFNGMLVKWFLQALGCKVGKNFKCLTIPRFKVLPQKNIVIGDNVTFGYNCVIEIAESGKLILDDFVLIGDRCMLSSMDIIHLKKFSAIAENVSLRGSMHRIGKSEYVRKQKNYTSPIILNEDVSIGVGSIILMGVTIPKGVFIGANSLVTRKTTLHPYTIYAGNPLRKIKERE